MSGLVDRLKNGGNIVIAEGYMWELERRGYVSFGSYTPQVVLEKPTEVKLLSEAFDHAGSDVIEAYTYFGYRDKLRAVGYETDLELLNRQALRIAKEVASASGKLMAGNISNTPLYRAGKPGPIAALPVCFRVTPEQPTMQSLKDPLSGVKAYPDNIDCLRCTREDVRKFAEEAKAAGVQYIGLCCGNGPNLIREVADVYGRSPAAMKYATDMNKSTLFGNKADDYMRSHIRKMVSGD